MKFAVRVRKSTYDVVETEVEAESADEAEAIARERNESGGLDDLWDGSVPEVDYGYDVYV